MWPPSSCRGCASTSTISDEHGNKVAAGVLHFAEVLAATRPLTPVRLGLEEAEGGVLAEDATALRPLPSFDNAGMDGYAVHAADVAAAAPGTPVTLPVTDEIRKAALRFAEPGYRLLASRP